MLQTFAAMVNRRDTVLYGAISIVGWFLFGGPAPVPTKAEREIAESKIIGRITIGLCKGICQTQPCCTCYGNKLPKERCHAVRRYSTLMLPVAQHLFKIGEYKHGP
jgi:hypothetical protein